VRRIGVSIPSCFDFAFPPQTNTDHEKKKSVRKRGEEVFSFEVLLVPRNVSYLAPPGA